jgi:hypothetical protein
MDEEIIARLSRRYLALDIHKHYSVVAGVNFEGQVCRGAGAGRAR